MFDHKHYVPVLKSKAGERWALGNLKSTTRLNITPVIELHEHKVKAAKEHLPELCDDLLSVWGTDRPFFMDTVWLHNASGSGSIIKMAFDAARACGLKAIPVVRLTYGTAAKSEIQQIVAKDKRGCMLRVPNDQSTDATAINSTLHSIGIQAKQADFLIDYQGSKMDLGPDVPAIPHVMNWRTLIAASGAFPKTFTGYTPHTWYKIDRSDFNSWEADVTKPKFLPRRPSFSDFTCRDPGAPAEFGLPSVNIRYTCKKHWLFYLGRKVKGGGSSDMPKACADLIKRSEYCGSAFSAGDLAISDTANGLLGPGNATQWVQWFVNHHIEFTSQQLQSHPAL